MLLLLRQYGDLSLIPSETWPLNPQSCSKETFSINKMDQNTNDVEMTGESVGTGTVSDLADDDKVIKYCLDNKIDKSAIDELLNWGYTGIQVSGYGVRNNRSTALERTAALATRGLKCILLVPNLRPRLKNCPKLSAPWQPYHSRMVMSDLSMIAHDQLVKQ